MQQHKRRRKGGLIHYPVLILFSVFFVGMFLLDCVTPDRTVSELENTTLTQRPKSDRANLVLCGAEPVLQRLHPVYERPDPRPRRLDQPAELCGDGPAPKDPERRHPAGGIKVRCLTAPTAWSPARSAPCRATLRRWLPLAARCPGQGVCDGGPGGFLHFTPSGCRPTPPCCRRRAILARSRRRWNRPAASTCL